MKKEKKCSNCRRKLDIGVDAIRVNHGVIGMKDFVPLDDTLFFCRENCLKDYYDLSDLPKMPPRIP